MIRIARYRIVVVVPRQRYRKYTYDSHIHFFPDEFQLFYGLGISEVTQHLAQLGLGGEVEQYISYASPYLRIFSQLVIGWQFLKQSIVAETALANGANDEDFYHAKLATARFYVDTIMPTSRPIAKLILAGDRSSFDYKEEWFRCEAGVGAMA
ncbi:MAG: acyl-CoA dehydrogenase C-terminal domain-containing protein [Candidatus Hydrogenedentes bacterium]|nr:acyl-CoA dehydrogenase C-terminal domain-containing protein [Candidatus Hydrogenedentota bacterium]